MFFFFRSTFFRSVDVIGSRTRWGVRWLSSLALSIPRGRRGVVQENGLPAVTNICDKYVMVLVNENMR